MHASKNHEKICFFFFWGEHSPDATEAFQLLPRRHRSLHHNGKDSRYRDWCCRANTSDVVINHTNYLHHPQVLSQVPITKQQIGRLQGKCRWWGSNPRPSQRQPSTLPLDHARFRIIKYQWVAIAEEITNILSYCSSVKSYFHASS